MKLDGKDIEIIISSLDQVKKVNRNDFEEVTMIIRLLFEDCFDKEQDETQFLKQISQSITYIENITIGCNVNHEYIPDDILNRFVDIEDLKTELIINTYCKLIEKELNNLNFTENQSSSFFKKIINGEFFSEFNDKYNKIVTYLNILKSYEYKFMHVHLFFGEQNEVHSLYKKKLIAIKTFFNTKIINNDPEQYELEILEILRNLKVKELNRSSLLEKLLKEEVIIESDVLIKPMVINILDNKEYLIGSHDEEIIIRNELLKIIKKKFHELLKEEYRNILKL